MALQRDAGSMGLVVDRSVLLIVNPVSGGKPGSTTPLSADANKLEPDALADALRSRGLLVRTHVLSEEEDPAGVARGARPDEDVVVAGGDGTVGPVAEVLTGSERALGIIPMGSWNNIARGLGIPTELEPALDVIGRGRVAQVDAGLAWHSEPGDDTPADAHAFFEAAGVGLDAAGFGAVELGERAGWRFAARAAWRALRKHRTTMLIELDGKVLRRRAPAVTVCIGPYHGLGFALVADADPADGLFDIAVFSGMSELDVVRHFLAVARGRERREPRIEVVRAKRVTVRGARRVLPVHADGHSIGITPVTFEVQPGALRVFR
jgi:diacylglycerol kinase (ATP)